MIVQTVARLRRPFFGATNVSPGQRVLLACIAATFPVAAIALRFRCVGCLLEHYDDAYITYRYARNLATGHGLVFNPGEATDSASSWLYTLLLALGYRLGIHDLRALSLGLGLAGAAVTGAVVMLACLARTNRWWLSLGLAAATGCHGFIAGWAVSGMETLFFTALVALAVYRLFVLRTLGWTESLLVSACVLTRLEGLLLAAAFAVLALARALAGDAVASQRRRVAMQAGAVALAFAVFLLFKWRSYGTLLPHAFELKRITSLYAPDPNALFRLWLALAPCLLLLGGAGLLHVSRDLHGAVFVSYCALSAASLALGPSADWARYSVHMLPVAAILGCIPLSILWQHVPVLAIAALISLGLDARGAFQEIQNSNQMGQGHAKCRETVGRYIESNLSPGSWVVSSDIGAIAYAAPSIRFIDTVGLTSSDILRARSKASSPEPILFAKQPLVIADSCDGSCTKPRQFSADHWLSRDHYWLTPLPAHERYFDQLKDGRELTRCVTSDKFVVGAAKFTRRVPGPAQDAQRIK